MKASTKIATWNDLRQHYADLRGVDWRREGEVWSTEAQEWADLAGGQGWRERALAAEAELRRIKGEQ